MKNKILEFAKEYGWTVSNYLSSYDYVIALMREFTNIQSVDEFVNEYDGKCINA